MAKKELPPTYIKKVRYEDTGDCWALIVLIGVIATTVISSLAFPALGTLNFYEQFGVIFMVIIIFVTCCLLVLLFLKMTIMRTVEYVPKNRR